MRWFLLSIVSFAGLLDTDAAALVAAEPIKFNRDIRPILSNHCWQCHGPDARHRKGDLRLDTPEGAVASSAVIPGKPEASELIKRIHSDDPESVMPPAKINKPLSKDQKELLRRWIADGAKFEGHWAFAPVQAPDVPPVRSPKWVKNEIDRFILARLEARGIAPSPEADRGTLIRRLSLDLTGLLPTVEEVDAFVKDTRPDAYEQLVERLLKSPHYGERWGRHWLDQARYADSNGYTIDSERIMWPYRDWVIKALNEDMPFNQFTIEQLAGDLLPNPTKLQRLATAFHRNSMINEEGGTDAEQFRNEAVVDRVNTTGAVWLGLTLGCAQCHNHKYDPISQKEYFQLFAFFNQGSDVNNRGDTLEISARELRPANADTERVDPALKLAREKRDLLQKSLADRQKAWIERLASREIKEPTWSPFELETFTAGAKRTLKKLPDGSLLASKEGPANDTYSITGKSTLNEVSAFRLEVLPHESIPGGGSGLAGNGNFVLSEVEFVVDGKPVPIVYALASHAKDKYPVNAAIDGDKKSGWSLELGNGGKGAHEAWFLLDHAVPPAGRSFTIRLHHNINKNYLIGRFRISFLERFPESSPDRKRWEQATAIARKPAAQRSEAEQKELTRLFTELDRDLAVVQRQIQLAEGAASKPVPVMVMKDIAKPRPTYIHIRGDFLNPDKKTGILMPNTPAVLPPLNAGKNGATRLDLARWLVRDDNPLTPRVTVNRIWLHYFGEGLVETENDFGMQGSLPTHPELLDYLAASFIKNGWSLKQLHRLIVTSATYRQSSKERPDLKEIDARNTLLARQNRLRVDAEIVRDIALNASGLLDLTLGGPTVRPYQPEGVYAFTQVKRNWIVSAGSDRYRRTMYTHFFRSAPYPLLSTFDAPNCSTVCTKRVRSNTPLQSLMMANDASFMECAQAMTLRLWKETPGNDAGAVRDRVIRAYKLCFSREPSARELELIQRFLEQQTQKFAADNTAAKLVAPAGRPADVSEAAAAAWTALVRALLNTDEFITRE